MSISTGFVRSERKFARHTPVGLLYRYTFCWCDTEQFDWPCRTVFRGLIYISITRKRDINTAKCCAYTFVLHMVGFSTVMQIRLVPVDCLFYTPRCTIHQRLT